MNNKDRKQFENAIKEIDKLIKYYSDNWEISKNIILKKKFGKKGIVLYFLNNDKKSLKLLNEYNNTVRIPKTTLTVRFDKGKTHPPVEDHGHVFFDGSQLYAINKSGTSHDGTKAILGKKEIKFFNSLGYKTPINGILEYCAFNNCLEYNYIIIPSKLLLD